MCGSGSWALSFQQLLPSFLFLLMHFSHLHSPGRQYGAGLRAQILETNVCVLNPSSTTQELCNFAQVTQPLCASLMSCMKWDKWWYQPPKLWGLNRWIHIKFFEQPLIIIPPLCLQRIMWTLILCVLLYLFTLKYQKYRAKYSKDLDECQHLERTLIVIALEKYPHVGL